MFSKNNERRSSVRRKSGTFLSIPLALKRKKSLNEFYNKSSTRTIQVPSEAFKPNGGAGENSNGGQADDMEIDENQDFNTGKARTLASFYPSSIRASKDLDKHTKSAYVAPNTTKEDLPLSPSSKIAKFHEKCDKDFLSSLRKSDFETLSVPEEVSEYADEVFCHMFNTESLFLAKYGYMRSQDDINEKMRAILVDWLIEVHFKFKLLPETLFITVNLIDRYLEQKQIARQKLQLLGVTAMWIA
jgi:hypothetical protein